MRRAKEVRLKKVPLKPLIEMLMDVHDKGLDFIDIVGTPNDVQDFVGIEFREDYFCKGERKAEDMFIEEEEGYDEVPPKKLTQEDLDQLSGI